jgi:hypothetical protein
LFLSGEIRYYRGVNKVRVVTQSEGYLTVEALEDFEDFEDGHRVHVKSGEQRIIHLRWLLKRENPAAYDKRAHLRATHGKESQSPRQTTRNKNRNPTNPINLAKSKT